MRAGDDDGVELAGEATERDLYEEASLAGVVVIAAESVGDGIDN